MGEVYRALDTRLDRAVAIKSLPAELSGDPERRRRFEREAKSIAALSHPHICTLYDVGHHEGFDFLVMELLEGETLAARLERGRLESAEVLACATQIAGALDQAHRQGIIHRDLKPANVMLTRSGAKLLDFGLAKLRTEGAPIVNGLTKTAQLTGHGQIVGTLQYMAPEQLEGKEVDARCDLFAFGAIVYEMVTGQKAFEGPSQASLIAAILHRTPPPITQVAPDAPPALERLLAVCLAQNPDDRWSTAHDVYLQLKEISQNRHSDPAPGIRRGTLREPLAWGVAAAAILAVIALTTVIIASRGPRSEGGLDLLSVLPAEQTTLANGEAPQISPDGQYVAFVASDRSGKSWLYVRKRDSLTARALPESEEATLPFWAPDSHKLGFFAQGQVKTISISGGSPRTLAPAPVPRGGTWSRDNLILFSARPNAPPSIVPAAGGEDKPVPIAGPFLGFRWFPSFLPDGRHYLYLVVDSRNQTGRAIRVASLDSVETKELVSSRANAIYASGHLLYRREAAVVAQPFNPRTMELSGTPAPVLENVGFNAITFQGLFSVSGNGVMAYQTSTSGSQLVWFDRQGKRLGAALPPGDYNTLCLTSDEKQVVYDQSDPASDNVDLWALDLVGGHPSRLTFDPAVDFDPVCSPAGHEVVFASLREGPPNLFRLMMAAPGSEKAVVQSPQPKIVNDWSGNGQLLVYSVLNAKSNWDIMVAPISGGTASVLVATGAEERNARMSPGGRWFTYVSNETGSFEVYVQPFPITGTKWQVSKGGGHQPQWRRDGRELYYISPDRKLIAVDIKPGGSEFATGESRALMETRITGWGTNQGCQYAATADGERFLVSTATDAILPITLVLNWPAALSR